MIDRRHILKLGVAALSAGVLGSGAPAGADAARILFLGGTGFIGPHIIHAALARGHQVAMMNRGQREPNQNAGDFARVEAIRGDRSLPNAYANLAGKKWDVVIDTATKVAWTREAVAALKGSAGPVHVHLVDRRISPLSNRGHPGGWSSAAHRHAAAESAELRRDQGAERTGSPHRHAGPRPRHPAQLHRRSR